jgi:hypothetical protein
MATGQPNVWMANTWQGEFPHQNGVLDAATSHLGFRCIRRA